MSTLRYGDNNEPHDANFIPGNIGMHLECLLSILKVIEVKLAGLRQFLMICKFCHKTLELMKYNVVEL